MELEQFKSQIIPLRNKLHAYAKGIFMNEVDAEDVVQETFLKLWNVRYQLNSHPNKGGFAMQILKNACIDRLRKKQFDSSIDNVPIAENSATPYTYTEQSNSIAIIHKIIETLPETQRRTILMRDVEGYELKEIADIIGADESTVRVNLSRARKTVRNKFISMNQEIL